MNKQRIKNIIIYIIIVLLFIVFSLYIVTRNKDNNKTTNTKPKDEIVTNIDSNDNNEDINKDEIGSEYEKDSKNIVNEFLKSYHLINDIDPLKSFENAKKIVVEPLYMELKNEVVGISLMNTNGFVYRTIEDMKIYDYSFDDANKNINIKAKVYSNWLDKDKSISSKNEITEYDFLLINDMGNWKISQMSSSII